jgi:hypothetical protein
MAGFEFTHIEMTDYQGGTLPNRFLRQTGEAKTLGVALPGLNYTCDMPLLYYPARLLTQHGADVLQVYSDYTRPDFQSSSRQEQARWLGADALAAVQGGWRQRDYARLVLIGKSIGTLALASLVGRDEGREAVTIWLTPLLRQPWLVEAALGARGPGFYAVGSGDATYDPAALGRIREVTGAEAIVLEGANHSLEVPGDVRRSLEYMQEFIGALEAFLEGRLAQP